MSIKIYLEPNISGISLKMCILCQCVRVKINKRLFEPSCVWILFQSASSHSILRITASIITALLCVALPRSVTLIDLYTHGLETIIVYSIRPGSWWTHWCFSFAEYFVFCIYSGSRTVVLAPFALTGGHVSIFH